MQIKNESLKEMLTQCGWHEDRNIDISKYKAWADKYEFSTSDVIYDFLKSFGGLKLKIPFKTTGYEKIEEDDSDSIKTLAIDPTFLVEDYGDYIDYEDFSVVVLFLMEMVSVLNSDKMFPIAFTEEDPSRVKELYMSTTGKIYIFCKEHGAYVADNFEEALLRIMTEDNFDWQMISY